MKSARERAEEIEAFSRPNPLSGVSALAMIERHIREAMRDQRHVCAEAVSSLPADYFTDFDGEEQPVFNVDGCHAAVMNAPEPGTEEAPRSSWLQEPPA